VHIVSDCCTDDSGVKQLKRVAVRQSRASDAAAKTLATQYVLPT